MNTSFLRSLRLLSALAFVSLLSSCGCSEPETAQPDNGASRPDNGSSSEGDDCDSHEECDDGNPCTTGTCDPDEGCVFTPIEGDCDLDHPCLIGVCEEGVCVPAGPGECDDGNPCTTGTCDPDEGCVFTPIEGECDDGDACTTGNYCEDGVCVSTGTLDCEDDNPCTVGSCDPDEGCVFTPREGECDDSNACTTDTYCDDGVCVASGDLDCDDGNPCTDASCDPAVGCVYVNNTDPCDDGDVCTTESVCQDGMCVPTAFVDCDLGEQCMEYGCDPTAGCWSQPLTGTPCDDGLMCTVDETCLEGVCVGMARVCDDGNDCTQDYCLEGVGCMSDFTAEEACELHVVITEPARGSTLDESALLGGSVEVSGYVESPGDPSPTFTLNGQAVSLTAIPPADPPESDEINPGVSKHFGFEVSLVPEHAMNLLEAEASDAFGQEASRLQSFYYSTVWNPVASSILAASWIEAGLILGLSQDFLDDGDPDTTDLAAIISLLVDSIDLMDAIPSPAAHVSEMGCEYDMYVTDAHFNGNTTQLGITEEGLELEIWMHDLHIDFILVRTAGGWWCPGDQTGVATADALYVNAQIDISIENGEIVAALDEDTLIVELQNLNVSVDSWFANLIVGMFQGTIQQMLEDELESVIKEQFEPLIEGLFDALLLDMDLEIPPLLPGGSPAMVELRTNISGLELVEEESMTIEMDATVLAAQGVPYTVLGALGYANCLASPFTRNHVDFGVFERINLGFFDDVANQILHAAWHTGAFELVVGEELLSPDMLAQYGLSDVDADISLLLPPVFTGCKQVTMPDAPADALMLELGDLEVEASFLLNDVPVHLLAYASLRGAATIGMATNAEGETELGMTILGIDEVFVDIVYVETPDPAIASLIPTMVEMVLIPMLIDELDEMETIGFPLPEFDLSDPDMGVPDGLTLQIVPQEVYRTDNGNTVMKGTVE